jgi:hypothetical protein
MNDMHFARCLAVVATFTVAAAARAADAPPEKLSAAQSKFFESRVRPILAANCYKCHSAEEHKNKGGLTLDSRDGWKKGGKHGPAIVPNEPDKSLLIKAIRYEDPDLQMPPDGGKLKDGEIAALEEWVKMGAPDPRQINAVAASKLTGLTDAARKHWAYQPVKLQTVPAVNDPGWVKTPVDAFVLAKLQAEKMHPSPPAPREALIRRATFDLIGLPPTPEEVADFVNDASPDAFAKVVDRLLASPQYGERWGRHWLDTARYSDTTGSENRKEDYQYPFAWTYRDYVINSFNADKPYDVFLKEQVAADLMPDARNDPTRLAGLGFLTVGKRFQNPHDTIDERIDTLTKSMMALTVACARCHDHKFDPIPTADYYSLHGIFASTVEPMEQPLIGAAPSGPEYDAFNHELAKLESATRERYFELLKSKSKEFRAKAGDYLYAGLLRRKKDADSLKERYKLVADAHLDRDLFNAGQRRVRRDDPVFAPMAMFAQLTDEQFATGGAEDVLARLEKQQRSKRSPLNPLVAEAFSRAKPESLRSLKDVTAIYAKLFADADAKADEYLEACRAAKTPEVTGFDPAVVELASFPVAIEPAATLTIARLRELAPSLPVVNQGGYKYLQLAQISQLLLTNPSSPPRAMVVADAPQPKDSHIFIRGEQQSKGELVPRRFLAIIAGKDRKPFTQGSGRLELAEAIASKDNPLTARVMVNRIWMHHFGQGFVRTPDDLGVQSEPPSHPALLDYLAAQFVENGWSVKAMHRLIMLSSTYQQSSETNPEYAQRDPDNRLLWRANLRRLDFEAVRDSMLMFTGKLDLAPGGKPVNLTDEPYSNRRSVYGYIDRGDLPELMAQFDFADPDMANSRRTSTIVPQQALFFMNSPMAVDVARKVTSRPEFEEASDDAGRVKALYEVLFQRQPRPEEIRFADEFLSSAGAVDQVAAADKPADRPLSKAEAREAKAERARLVKKVRQEQAMAAQNAKRRGARGAIRNEGEIVARKPLTPWEQYAQALLFTNEIAYVN